MKVSKYNIIKKLKDKYIVFNSNTCSLVELDEEYMKVISDIDGLNKNIDKHKQDIIDQLSSVGILIDESFDEVELLKLNHNRCKFNNDVLNITIAPTLDCNFACPYCFENNIKGNMNIKVQEKLLNLIKMNIVNSKRLEVVWYGGEPLLAIDVIENLDRNINEIIAKYKLEYCSFMVTNGYLIDEKMIERLKKLSLNSIQITLDGPPKINNKRRIFKGENKDTFSKIISALKLLVKNKFNVVLRVNVDKLNYPYISDLLNILKINNLDNIKITFGHVLPYNNISGSMKKNFFNKKEYADVVYQLQKVLHEKLFKYDNYAYPSPKCIYCNSVSLNSFLIDPEGDLYKCWCDIGNKNKSIENIMNLKDDTILAYLDNYKNNVKLINYSPFDNETCLNCKLLPICLGGCPKIGLKKEDCIFWKYNIDKLIEYTYEL